MYKKLISKTSNNFETASFFSKKYFVTKIGSQKKLLKSREINPLLNPFECDHFFYLCRNIFKG